MFFESLNLISFGPFTDFQLTLTPGLNVIYGPNEAGKSSCHAAAYAALCGLRRGRGQSREGKEFEEQYRPWEGELWRLSTILQLADKRRIELHQDLLARISGQALDLTLGHDLSSEIIDEGMADGARWLGLDRRLFMATACIRQAEILAVVNQPQLLTEHLQRAAATGGSAESAAAAIALIDEARRQSVGPDRLSSTRPLGAARAQVERCGLELERARNEHQQYLELVVESERLTERTAKLEAELEEQRNRQAWYSFEQQQERLAEAERSLTGGDIAPPAPIDDEAAEVPSPSPALPLAALTGAGMLALAALWSAFTGHPAISVTSSGLAGLLSLAGLFLLRQAKREKAIRRENRNRQWQQRQRMEQLMAESHSARQLALDELRRQLHRQIPKATKPTDIGAGEPSPAQLSTLEIELAQLRRQADQAQGAASSLAQRIASVPLAEEEWERSQAELQRILQLEQTLQLSREFLEQAQDSVHRDIAPRLAHTLKSWLPKVTGGRYTDAIVDPESLEVRVCGRSRQWRKATLLSHGTREQIYLLLRLALVEHLTREGESAPLLLDEITVHSDQGRTRAILELIQQFTPAHQVLFFSQEVEIAKWAEQHLQAPHDQLIELTGPAAM